MMRSRRRKSKHEYLQGFRSASASGAPFTKPSVMAKSARTSTNVISKIVFRVKSLHRQKASSVKNILSSSTSMFVSFPSLYTLTGTPFPFGCNSTACLKAGAPTSRSQCTGRIFPFLSVYLLVLPSKPLALTLSSGNPNGMVLLGSLNRNASRVNS